MTLKLAVWDIDGTLVDSRQMIQRAMEVAFDETGLAPPDFEATRKIVGLKLETALAELAPDIGPDRLAKLTHAYQQSFITLRHDPDIAEPLYDGALELLEHLVEDGWLMGVATGKSRRGVTSVLERHNLGRFFDAHYCADDGPGKPHPHMIDRNMDDLGCFAENTVMIGDATFDMIMARAASVRALGVSWGFGAAHELEAAGAHELHHDFASLKSALNRFKQGEAASE